MAKKGGLGKGLNALFSDNTVEVEEKAPASGIQMVRLSQVEINRHQPRKTMDEEKIQQLADSIAQHGIIQPLIVRSVGEEQYQIVAGERRWRAAKMAGLQEVPVVVKDYTDQQVAEIALVENLQREDLNPMEEAEGYHALMQDYGLTQEQVSQRVGKSRPAVANALRLMQLPDDVADLVKFGKLSAGHARTLIPLGSRAMEAAGQVISGGLSVRQTERLVKKMLKPEGEKQETKQDPHLHQVEEDLTECFGRKVKIHHGAKRGRIELEYYSNEDLETLITLLKGRI